MWSHIVSNYCRAAERGYPESFDTFVLNYCTTDWTVTVNGEPTADYTCVDSLARRSYRQQVCPYRV